MLIYIVSTGTRMNSPLKMLCTHHELFLVGTQHSRSLYKKNNISTLTQAYPQVPPGFSIWQRGYSLNNSL